MTGKIEQEVLQDVLEAFFNNHAFMMLQLDFAVGNSDQEEFTRNAERYLVKKLLNQDEYKLRRKVEVLLRITLRELDADTISTIFSCPIKQAERVLFLVKERQLKPHEVVEYGCGSKCR